MGIGAYICALLIGKGFAMSTAGVVLGLATFCCGLAWVFLALRREVKE
jgi:hypothetical protein